MYIYVNGEMVEFGESDKMINFFYHIYIYGGNGSIYDGVKMYKYEQIFRVWLYLFLDYLPT